MTNHNYYNIRVVNCTVNILSDNVFARDPTILLGKGVFAQEGGLSISSLSTGTVNANATISLDYQRSEERIFYDQCSYISYFISQFQWVVYNNSFYLKVNCEEFFHVLSDLSGLRPSS